MDKVKNIGLLIAIIGCIGVSGNIELDISIRTPLIIIAVGLVIATLGFLGMVVCNRCLGVDYEEFK